MKHLGFLTMVGSLGVTLLAGTAHATVWTIERNVTEVAITDNANRNGQGTAKLLEITVSSAGSFCGAQTTNLQISSTESPTMFEHWVRLAQSAHLSGKKIKVATTNETSGSACKTWYVQIK